MFLYRAPGGGTITEPSRTYGTLLTILYPPPECATRGRIDHNGLAMAMDPPVHQTWENSVGDIVAYCCGRSNDLRAVADEQQARPCHHSADPPPRKPAIQSGDVEGSGAGHRVRGDERL